MIFIVILILIILMCAFPDITMAIVGIVLIGAFYATFAAIALFILIAVAGV